MRYQDEASAEREKATLNLFLEVGIYGPEDTFVDSLQILHPQATIGLSYSPATGLEQVAAAKAFICTQIKHLEKIIEQNRQLIDSFARYHRLIVQYRALVD